MRFAFSVAAFAVVGMVGSTTSAAARTLQRALVPPSVRGTFLEAAINPLSTAISTQVANQIPTLSTSAGYTYEWNPELEVLERSAKTFGPLFTERAVTLGRNKFNLSASYSYIRFQSFNGKDIDKLMSQAEVARVPETGDIEFFGPSRQADLDGNGTQEALIGDQLRLDLELETQLWDFSFTYGVLDNLDVNIDIPVLYTYARSSLVETLPDPRCLGVSADCDALFGADIGDHAAVVDGVPGSFTVTDPSADRDDKLGIGDIHLRAKYAPLRRPFNMAVLLDLSLPTGKKKNFQGTGDTRLQTSLVASKDVLDFLEVHTQAGVLFNINTVDRSDARYAVGLTAQATNWMALTVDFIGRSEFGPQSRIPNTGRLPAVRTIGGEPTLTQPRSEIDGLDENGDPVNEDDNFKGRPIFVDIKRNDILDLAVGTRLGVGEFGILFVNFLVPLNQDGLRADFVPTVGFEMTF
ncbi:MAG: hypothetical protein IT293_04345 [Deltaproteobacteria bacterium]|nr:hypothetical protein [Deltaproteobacteria bacterium]